MTVLRDDGPRVLGGQDQQSGGTWLALNEWGVFAGLTNQPRQPGAMPRAGPGGAPPGSDDAAATRHAASRSSSPATGRRTTTGPGCSRATATRSSSSTSRAWSSLWLSRSPLGSMSSRIGPWESRLPRPNVSPPRWPRRRIRQPPSRAFRRVLGDHTVAEPAGADRSAGPDGPDTPTHRVPRPIACTSTSTAPAPRASSATEPTGRTCRRRSGWPTARPALLRSSTSAACGPRSLRRPR